MRDTLKITLYRPLLLNNSSLIFGAYLIVAFCTLWTYLPLDSLTFILGLASLPFVMDEKVDHKKSLRFGIISLLCLVLTFAVPVKTLLYFSIAFGLLFLMECFYKRASILVPVVILLVSPAFQYVVNVFSFPIRLQLSQVAGAFFTAMKQPIVVAGNTIFYNNHEFSVDPACMGLNMLTASLLAGILLIGLYQKQLDKTLRPGILLFYLLFIVGLNIICNLLRIVFLLQFAVLPGTVLHELTGLLCFLVYVLFPITFIAKKMVARWGKTTVTTTRFVVKKQSSLLHLFLLTLTCVVAVYVSRADTYKGFDYDGPTQWKGYQVAAYGPGILKVENSRCLIYVKYIRGFYDTDHNPTLCWKGSGFTFENIEKKAFGGTEIYTATLQQQQNKLYTAWWYGNGRSATINQWQWRWGLLQHKEKYAVVNVAAATKEELEKELEQVIQQGSLVNLF